MQHVITVEGRSLIRTFLAGATTPSGVDFFDRRSDRRN